MKRIEATVLSWVIIMALSTLLSVLVVHLNQKVTEVVKVLP
jgi:hypothetical protein